MPPIKWWSWSWCLPKRWNAQCSATRSALCWAAAAPLRSTRSWLHWWRCRVAVSIVAWWRRWWARGRGRRCGRCLAAVAHWRRLLLLLLLLPYLFVVKAESVCRLARGCPLPARIARLDRLAGCVINLSVGDFYGPARHSPLLAAVYNQIINALQAFPSSSQPVRCPAKTRSDQAALAWPALQRQAVDLLSLSRVGVNCLS